MGLFRELGQKVERFKQDAKAAATDDAEYECAACGTAVDASRDRCPECGSDEVVQRTTDE